MLSSVDLPDPVAAVYGEVDPLQDMEGLAVVVGLVDIFEFDKHIVYY